MGADIGHHPFEAFQVGHPYRAIDKCAACFQLRAHPIHGPEPEPVQP